MDDRDDSGTPMRALLQSLQNADCFDHEVERFELLETHISFVLLTGPFAYKLKKPIRLDFLDFETLERRKHYLGVELELNRRTAPELYLALVTISGPASSPRVNGPGPPIEYALKMVEFPQARRLDRVVARGELRTAHIRELARDVARFHTALPRAGKDSPFGCATRIRTEVMENFDTLDSSAKLPAPVNAQAAEIKRWSARELERHRDRFERRRQAGFIRECHGDLHLANIALLGERAVPFDCIEFNEDLRWIDLMSEVSFLFMDLCYQGRRDLAQLFLNLYLEQTGDYPGLNLLRHYLVYRAMVRAKVSAIRLAQEGIQLDTARSELESLCTHLELAEQFTRPARATPLVVTHGLSGSGKSWLAEQLVMSTETFRVRSDVERKRLVKVDRYTEEASEQTYRQLARLAGGIVRAGYGAVADATFLKQAERERFMRLAIELSVPFVILHADAPESILRERIVERARSGADVSDANLAVLEGQQRAAEPLSEREARFLVRVDTARTIDIADLIERIESSPRP